MPLDCILSHPFRTLEYVDLRHLLWHKLTTWLSAKTGIEGLTKYNRPQPKSAIRAWAERGLRQYTAPGTF